MKKLLLTLILVIATYGLASAQSVPLKNGADIGHLNRAYSLPANPAKWDNLDRLLVKTLVAYQPSTVTATSLKAGARGTCTSGTTSTPVIVDTGVLYICVSNAWTAVGVGTGTVTSVSVTTANGVSGSVATATTTPAITLTLGAITPSSVTVGGVITQTSASATAFESGPNGATNPVLRLVNSTASQADGVSITGNAAGSGTTFTGLSSGSTAGFLFAPKGTAGVSIGTLDNAYPFNAQVSASGATNIAQFKNANTAGIPYMVLTAGTGGAGLEFRYYGSTVSTSGLQVANFGHIRTNNSNGGVIINGGTATGIVLLATNEIERARVSAAGGFSIGTATDPGATNILVAGTIKVSGSTWTMDNAAYFSCTALTTNGSGVIGCTASDERLKRGFQQFNGGLGTINKIHPKTFQWRDGTFLADGGKQHLGLVAQDLQRADPLLVSANGKGILQPEPMALAAVTVSAIQELDAKIAKLTALVESQQKEINRLKRGHK